MKIFATIACVGLLSALARPLPAQDTPAGPSPTGPAPPEIGKPERPDWIRKPTREEIDRAYPRESIMAGEGGTVWLKCKVTPLGQLADCLVDGDGKHPVSLDAAALTLAPLYKMKAVSQSGHSVAGGEVHLPVRFNLPPELPTVPGPDTPRSLSLRWAKGQSADFLDRFYPSEAKREGGAARVKLLCQVVLGEHLEDCDVLEESPGSRGFGAAAKAAVAKLKIDASTTLFTDPERARVTLLFRSPLRTRGTP